MGDEETSKAPVEVTTNPPDEETSEAPTTWATKAAPEESTTLMEGSTSLPPLVPCPFECPAEFGYFEVEPCSPFYCSCSNYIGYLQECQEGTVFHPDLDNPGEGICDYPYNDPDCEEYPDV